ncbi:MAG: MBL fold metallo-hydrolase [Myxococcales bacterium]|nr:MBL fold metallo-hydrolase [Myxococcales bacterium]
MDMHDGLDLHSIHLYEQSGVTVDLFVVGHFKENCYFVHLSGRDEVVIIDPGSDAETLTSFIDEQHFRPAAILSTHGHLDHIGAVEALRQRYECLHYQHPLEQEVMQQIPMTARMYGIDPPTIPAVDRWLESDSRLTLAGLEIGVLHTPGHTPGSVCFAIRDAVFVGDTIFRGHVGRTDFPGSDYNAMRRSILEELFSRAAETTLFPGHGFQTTVGREQKTNPDLL